VKANDENNKQNQESSNSNHRFTNHKESVKFVVNSNHSSIIANEILQFEDDHRSTFNIQERFVSFIGKSIDGNRSHQRDVSALLWKNNLYAQLLNNAILESINQFDFQSKIRAIREQGTTRLNVVAKHVIRFPSSENRKTRPQVQFDAIIFLGGIDNSVEAEGNDRTAIAWTGNQLDLVSQLSALSKPLVVVQFGGGQVDDAALKNNSAVNSILWAGYPGQSGGTAILDVLKGKVSPAGRLVTTQYPADYVNEVPMTDMSLRVSSSNPGRTYKWYSGVPTFEFGTGLSFTSFALNFAPGTTTTYSIQSLVANGKSAAHLDLAAFDTFSVSVHNSGKVASDFVSLLFVKTTNAGPAPFPNKVLVSYARTKGIAPGQSVTARLAVTLGSIARVGTDGSAWLYPGDYSLLLDVPTAVTHNFRLTGSAAQITHFPVDTESS